MKKLRWLWSYQVNRTEKWLSDMAREGYHLCDFNAVTRAFTFEEGEPRNAIYAIRLDNNALPSALQQEGWHMVASSKSWQFVKNESSDVAVYPTRETILRRARMHTYLFILLAIFLMAGQINVLLMTTIISRSVGDISWLGIVIPLFILTLFISLSMFVYRAYRKFEKKEMDFGIQVIANGRKLHKIKLGWMYLPQQTKEWLEVQAEQGFELERVFGPLFTFRQTGRKNIAYEVCFEPKVDSTFFSIHKEIGWQLKFSSNLTWMHYSIWAMPYKEGEMVPAFMYDLNERFRSLKKSLFMSLGISGYLLITLAVSLYINFLRIGNNFFEMSIDGILRLLLIVTIALWGSIFLKIIIGFLREWKIVREGY